MDDEIVATGLPGEIEAPGVDGGVGCEFPLGGEDVEARASWARPQRGDVGAISAPREKEVRPPGADRERVVARGDDNRTSGRRRHERDRPVTGARPGGLGCDTAREGRSHDDTRRIGDDHPLESPDRQLPSDRRRVGRQVGPGRRLRLHLGHRRRPRLDRGGRQRHGKFLGWNGSAGGRNEPCDQSDRTQGKAEGGVHHADGTAASCVTRSRADDPQPTPLDTQDLHSYTARWGR